MNPEQEQIEMHKRVADLFVAAIRGKVDPAELRETVGNKATRIMREETREEAGE